METNIFILENGLLDTGAFKNVKMVFFGFQVKAIHIVHCRLPPNPADNVLTSSSAEYCLILTLDTGLGVTHVVIRNKAMHRAVENSNYLSDPSLFIRLLSTFPEYPVVDNNNCICIKHRNKHNRPCCGSFLD